METLMAGRHVYRRTPNPKAWWQHWHAIKHQAHNGARVALQAFNELRKDWNAWKTK
jgi:hypothetical protein